MIQPYERQLTVFASERLVQHKRAAVNLVVRSGEALRDGASCDRLRPAVHAAANLLRRGRV